MDGVSDYEREFITTLNFFLTKVKQTCPLIRKQKGDLRSRGDFTFPTNFEYWRRFLHSADASTTNEISTFGVSRKTVLAYCFNYGCGHHKDDSESDFTEQVLLDIVERSKNWPMVVSKCELHSDRVQLWLNRVHTLRSIIEAVLTKKTSYGECLPKEKLLAVTSEVQKEEPVRDLTETRIELLKSTVSKLAESAGFKVLNECNNRYLCLHLSTKSKCPSNDGCCRVLCGVVINSQHHSRESNLTAEDYLRQRCNDMKTVAEHKYSEGLESPTSSQDLISMLGEAAVRMDLLQIKPNHTVSLSTGAHRDTSSRGAAFALYNCARVSSILRQFEEKVKLNSYPPLIPFEEVDFSLLVKEEEWELAFLYLLAYPGMLQSCVEGLEQGKISPNLVCSFIMGMCGCFSVYYRRVRILTEPRTQLLPVMFARLHLLQAIQQVLHNALGILGIPPVSHM